MEIQESLDNLNCKISIGIGANFYWDWCLSVGQGAIHDIIYCVMIKRAK